jgi:hypothetical protein
MSVQPIISSAPTRSRTRVPSEVALPPGFSVYADEMQRVVGKLA